MKSDENQQKLEDVRELIDSVDRELIMLLKQRSRLIDLVIEIKKESGDSAYQPERFAEIMAHLQSVAEAEELDPQLVIEVLDAVHTSSQRQQNAVLKQSS